MKNIICVVLLAVFGSLSSSPAQATKDAPSSRYKGQYNMSLKLNRATTPREAKADCISEPFQRLRGS